MPTALLPTLLRRLAVLMVAVGIVAFASHAVPTNGVAVGALPWADAGGDGGHSHDDDAEGRDRPAGHGHSHNPADHSHDTLASGSHEPAAADEATGAWRRGGHDRNSGHAPDPLDRPPRSDAFA
ncbi:hypothetical protein [Azospirillum brasilense]|nr:hypothetical protein [Azospirillum brasilense]